jgi:uncharacterized protein YbgA (DUF1722 family)/uncharacterized protein YbbK (DUF523 family)
LREFVKPKVVISKCIEFENVRWDGQIISSDFVKKLMPHVEFIPVCPEVEIGLGVPRHPIRIVLLDGKLRLIQPATSLEVTEKMRSFADSFLDSLQQVDGFILKSRSPTSAIRDAKIYPSIEKKVAPISKGPGFFAAAVLERFPHLAIEDEGRLRNPRIKEHFLTKIFTLASFSGVKASNSPKKLVRFHSNNKLLFKTYNQKEARNLGRIVANQQKKPFAEIVVNYEQHLFKMLKRPPRCGSTINVMMDAMGYFSDKLSKEEKSFFLDSLEEYRAGKLPLSVNTGILKAWIIRFREDYLTKQTFFEPYPEELVDIDAMTIYCDGKDYWKR